VQQTCPMPPTWYLPVPFNWNWPCRRTAWSYGTACLHTL
jgi:hypothetical protein